MSGEDIVKRIVSQIMPMKRVKLSIGVLTSGDGSNLQALIDFSTTGAAYFCVSSVISNTPGSLAMPRAAAAGIKNYLVNHRSFSSKIDFEEQLIKSLSDVDLVVLAGFMRVLSEYFLSHYNDRVINLHPSLLPKHPGLNAIEKALVARDHESGCTVHLVDKGLDTGPIIAQSICAIEANDDLSLLKHRIQALEHRLLPSVVNNIAKMVITRDCA